MHWYQLTDWLTFKLIVCCRNEATQRLHCTWKCTSLTVGWVSPMATLSTANRWAPGTNWSSLAKCGTVLRYNTAETHACMLAHMHAHTHAQTYIHMHRHTHTFTHTHTCTDIHMHRHTHTHSRTHTCTHTDTTLDTNTCMHACTHTHAQTYTHACVHTCTHTHTCTHVHTHTHTHTHTGVLSATNRKRTGEHLGESKCGEIQTQQLATCWSLCLLLVFSQQQEKMDIQEHICWLGKIK